MVKYLGDDEKDSNRIATPGGPQRLNANVRIVDRDGEPWFVGADICKILNIVYTKDAYRRLDDQEKATVGRTPLGLNPGRPSMLISESGLYKLIMRSDKPEAKKFQDWVTRVCPILDRPPTLTTVPAPMNNNTTTNKTTEVDVCGSKILATITEDDKCYFSPKHVCQALGIGWIAQFEKIKADAVLYSVVRFIRITANDGKDYQTTMLPIEFLSGWLFTIKNVAPELQAKLNQYRAEAYFALDAWFRQNLRSNPEVQAVFALPNFTDPVAAARKNPTTTKNMNATTSTTTALVAPASLVTIDEQQGSC